MAQPTPLFPGAPQPEEPLDSPEVLVLNALLRSGKIEPHAYGLSSEMLSGYHQAWRFCEDYQEQVGEAPPIELFARSFPTIEILGGTLDPGWAADKLKQAHYEREVRRTLGEATRAMREGDLDAVREAVRSIAMPSPFTKPAGMLSTDPETVKGAAVKLGFRTPWTALSAITNGVGRGEVLQVGARYGQGKSWILPGFAVECALMGGHVKVASCEMPARQYMKRVHAWQAKGNLMLQRLLKDPEEKARLAAVEQLPALVGSIEVFDPSMIRMNLRAIETLAAEADMVLVDHIGLLMDSKGRRSTEDWRVAAEVSNSIKEIALRFDVAMVNAAQVNREGDNPSAAPKSKNLGGTDALGQDADLILMLKRVGIRSMLHVLDKNRDGPVTRYYTKYEPGTADFAEITPDEARVRAMEDEAHSMATSI